MIVSAFVLASPPVSSGNVACGIPSQRVSRTAEVIFPKLTSATAVGPIVDGLTSLGATFVGVDELEVLP